MNKSLSIFARALATENISFAFDASAGTASFDVKNRHLVMPVWNVSETLQSMLVAHEISHALWTPYERSEVLLKQAGEEGYCIQTLQIIANVIEDVRIERLMKEKYPGTRRDFFLGYKEIIDTDLFKFKGKDFSKASALNRLNTYLKWGIPGFLNFAMSEDEMAVVDEVLAVETFDEVIDLAKRLYGSQQFAKSVDALKKKFAAQGNGKGDKTGKVVPGEGSSMTGEGDPGSELLDMSAAIGKKDGETFYASTITLSPLANLDKQIVSTTDLMEIMGQRHVFGIDPLPPYRQFVSESDAFVRQLVAQFERRKAADEIRRERPKQTGMLDLDRLHQYRTHDDIFLSKIIKQEGKNHGIMFVIDFSGSMASSIGNCILQVLQLVWFCEKAKIPFEVYAFTDMAHPLYTRDREQAQKEYYKKNPDDYAGVGFTHPSDPVLVNPSPTSVRVYNCKLVNLASSADSKEKRDKILAGLYTSYCKEGHRGFLPMGGTPTVEAMMMVSQLMKEWVTANKIQIPTLMLVTDGQPNSIGVMDDSKAGTMFYRTGENTSLTVINEISDTVIRFPCENYAVTLPNGVIATIMESLRSTLNARIVGMFVGQRNLTENDYQNFCVSQKEWASVRGRSYRIEDAPRYLKAREQYKDGCILVVEDTFPGYDAFFLIKTPKIVKDEDAIAEKGSFVKVKNTFVKTMGQRGGSRVFLSKYVDIIAGQPLRKMDQGLYSLSAFGGLTA